MRLIIYFWILIFSSTSFAAEPSGVLLTIENSYKPLQGIWHAAIIPFAYSLFWKLVLLDVIVSTLKLALERKEFGDYAAWFSRKMLTIGFFYSVMKFSDTWIPFIIQSFALIGQKASGYFDASPDGIVTYGVDMALNMLAILGKLGVGDVMILFLPVAFFAILIFIAFCVVAGQLLVTLIESYIVVGAGVIMLGFSGSQWTSDMATAYLKYAVGTGVKLMMAYLIIGAGIVVFQNMSIDVDNLLKSCAIVCAQSLIFVFLAWNIPSMAGAMLSGSPSSTLGGLIASSTAAAAAVVATATFATQATKSGASAAKDLASGAKDLASGVSDLARDFGFNRSNSLTEGSKDPVTVPDPTGPAPTGSKATSNETNSSAGNAEDANISGKGSTASNAIDRFAEQQRQNKANSGSSMSDKIRDLNNFVPQDQANIQVQGINLSHGKD
jgi:P-type conjugative transfer protein TrbL